MGNKGTRDNKGTHDNTEVVSDNIQLTNFRDELDEYNKNLKNQLFDFIQRFPLLRSYINEIGNMRLESVKLLEEYKKIERHIHREQEPNSERLSQITPQKEQTDATVKEKVRTFIDVFDQEQEQNSRNNVQNLERLSQITSQKAKIDVTLGTKLRDFIKEFDYKCDNLEDVVVNAMCQDSSAFFDIIEGILAGLLSTESGASIVYGIAHGMDIDLKANLPVLWMLWYEQLALVRHHVFILWRTMVAGDNDMFMLYRRSTALFIAPRITVLHEVFMHLKAPAFEELKQSALEHINAHVFRTPPELIFFRSWPNQLQPIVQNGVEYKWEAFVKSRVGSNGSLD